MHEGIWKSSTGMVRQIDEMGTPYICYCMRIIYHIVMDKGLVGAMMLRQLRRHRYFALYRELKKRKAHYREVLNLD